MKKRINWYLLFCIPRAATLATVISFQSYRCNFMMIKEETLLPFVIQNAKFFQCLWTRFWKSKYFSMIYFKKCFKYLFQDKIIIKSWLQKKSSNTLKNWRLICKVKAQMSHLFNQIKKNNNLINNSRK